ncbi:thiamine pyrophosphate-dependent enzyme [Shewanella sp. AS16]|uniref:thiamine pyrophosphate-binding protein n=1 Tax=Shewanella sp. AS16 TaxID=2907625 RepID=UPI001F15DE0C|nr:thiamine pyrophosphate-binding protein [Shewanella sp. AS16]MCE9686118.1 thiamine pyrophosphate-dependent enzyme [Shewanella sp. AS16]
MPSTISQNFGRDYYTSLPSLGDSLGELLGFFGVKRLYGVGGDFVANLINALDGHLEVLPSSNEMHAGFSACAQAELNALGVCLTTYTVGSLPCTSAAALARTEGLPLVLLSGAPGEEEVGREALHHTVHPHTAWHTDLDAALNAFRALGVRAERLQGQRHSGQPNMAAAQCLELLSHAYLQRQPVFIEIPRDLIGQRTQRLQLPAELAQLRSRLPLNLGGAEMIATEIASRLSRASAPLLYLGETLRLNRPLLARILDFCHRLQLPYACSWFAKGMLDETHPLCLGSYNGVFSRLPHQAYIESQADYVLEIGGAIFPSDTNNAFGSRTHGIDNHPNKTMLKGTAPWELDTSAVLDALTSMPLQPAFSYGFLAAEPEPSPPPGREELGYHNLAQTVNLAQQALPEPYIFLPEVGNALFASFELVARASDIGRSYLANPWYAAMGTSLAYARAVADQLAECGSTQPMLVLTGDGGFNFQANELINLQKQGANLTLIYMRNNIFHLGKAGDAPIYACNADGFDPKLLIRAYGGQGHECDTAESLFACLLHTAAVGGLHLIEIPLALKPEYQSEIARKLNTYIGYRNGNAEATADWRRLCGR